MIFTEKQLRNFWSKVNKDGPMHPYNIELGNCWIWTAFTDKKKGYGSFGLNGKVERSHRVSWKINNLSIPPKILVCHSCDVTACVNPSHLFLGTNLENMKDRNSKNRQARPIGELQGAHKLIEDEIVEIRKLYSSGNYTQTELAKMFNVDQTNISCIVNFLTWKHIKE